MAMLRHSRRMLALIWVAGCGAPEPVAIEAAGAAPASFADAGTDGAGEAEAIVPCAITYRVEEIGDGTVVRRAVGSFDSTPALVRLVTLEEGEVVQVETFARDADGRALEHVRLNADGKLVSRSTTTYDADGHVLASSSDSNGDGRTDSATFAVYENGRLVREDEDPDGEGPRDPVTLKTYRYDADGMETSVVWYGSRLEFGPGFDVEATVSTECASGAEICGSGDERTVEYAADLRYLEGAIVRQYTYRSDGQPESVFVDFGADGDFETRTDFTYDANGRLETKAIFQTNTREPDERSVVESRDADGHPTRWRVARDGYTVIQEVTYNRHGDETETTESLESGYQYRRWTTEYDAMNRKTRWRQYEWDWETPSIERGWTYDAAGREATYEQRGLGTIGARTVERATRWRDDGLALAWEMDHDEDDSTDQVKTLEFDEFGAEISRTITGRGDAGPDSMERRRFDAVGRLVESTIRWLPGGEVSSIFRATFDDAGRPLTEVRDDTDENGLDSSATFAYDAAGHEITRRTVVHQGETNLKSNREAVSDCLPIALATP